MRQDMSVFSKSRMLGTVVVLAVLPMAVLAQSSDRGQPPKPDLTGMAKALGVEEAALDHCLPKPERGQRPERPDAKSLAACLKVDTAKVDTVLGQFGPKPRG